MKTKQLSIILITAAATLLSFSGCAELLSAVASAYVISPESIDGMWQEYEREENNDGTWVKKSPSKQSIRFNSNSGSGESNLVGKFTYTLQGRTLQFKPHDPNEVVRPHTIMWVREGDNNTHYRTIAWEYEANGKKVREYLRQSSVNSGSYEKRGENSNENKIDANKLLGTWYIVNKEVKDSYRNSWNKADFDKNYWLRFSGSNRPRSGTNSYKQNFKCTVRGNIIDGGFIYGKSTIIKLNDHTFVFLHNIGGKETRETFSKTHSIQIGFD